MKTQTILILILFFTLSISAQNENNKGYYLNTNIVYRSIKAYYIGCENKIVDTTYYLTTEYLFEENWEIFYDKDFKIKQADYFLNNDTFFIIQYYRNGKKKVEYRVIDKQSVYEAEWCKNGQLISKTYPSPHIHSTNTIYYCNGNKKWQGNIYKSQLYGTEIRWYKNGQKQSEKTYTLFNQELADKGLLKSVLISEKYWDKYGNETEPFNNDVININIHGLPIIISNNELKNTIPYYDIVDQPEYNNTMTMFKDNIYKTVKLKSLCHCEFGLIYISFTVSKKGIIKDIRLDNSLEECIDNAFLEAIEKTSRWKPGTVNGKIVNTRVTIALELEKIKMLQHKNKHN